MMPVADDTTPCVYNPWPFDVLIDDTRSHNLLRHALTEAADMCAGCDIRHLCLGDEFKDEPWAVAIRRVLVQRARKAAA